MSCGVGYRHGLDPELLWLWCGPVVTALIQPLAWEPPYAASAAPKGPKKKKKNCIMGRFGLLYYGLKYWRRYPS